MNNEEEAEKRAKEYAKIETKRTMDTTTRSMGGIHSTLVYSSGCESGFIAGWRAHEDYLKEKALGAYEALNKEEE